MSIKHLLFYIVRGTSSEALQKFVEMTPSNLKTELLDLSWGAACIEVECSW